MNKEGGRARMGRLERSRSRRALDALEDRDAPMDTQATQPDSLVAESPSRERSDRVLRARKLSSIPILVGISLIFSLDI